MKGFPKVIKTKSDLVNTFKLVQKKRLKKEDWLAAVEKLENQNWIMCPVIELSEDRSGSRAENQEWSRLPYRPGR